MMKKVEETLEKQLQLLFERSGAEELSAEELHHLTTAMVEIASILLMP